MPLDMGQGACQAIEGAVVLTDGRLAGSVDVASALRANEARPRTPGPTGTGSGRTGTTAD